MKSKRHYTPCRLCKKVHTNPASSSLCNECGPIVRLENLKLKEEMAEHDRLISEEMLNYNDN